MLDMTNQQYELVVFNCAKCKAQTTLYLKDKGGYYPHYEGYLCIPCRTLEHQLALYPENVD